MNNSKSHKGDYYSSFDLFKLSGVGPQKNMPEEEYVTIMKSGDSLKVSVFQGKALVSHEDFTVKLGRYIQEELYENEGKNLHRIISYRKDTIVTIVLNKIGKNYYLEEINEEIKTETTIIYTSKFFNSVDKVKLVNSFLSSFDDIYKRFKDKKSEILWEYVYRFTNDFCQLQRKHKQLESNNEYEVFLDETECHAAGIDEYFWLDRNPMFKNINCD